MNINKFKYDGKKKFNIKESSTEYSGKYAKKLADSPLFAENVNEIRELQEKMYAQKNEGLVIIFQATDAAGKDGVIRTVFSILSPHGVQEHCFKNPSSVDLSHDYMWRVWSKLPAKGDIALFNRSYYEEVLIGKVHQLYKTQKKADRISNKTVIKNRYQQINNIEKYLYQNSIRVVKIFLNLSKDEQAERFISRIDEKDKNWKVSPADIGEREYWDEYQQAFEDMINNTSTRIAPWYVVPADHKWYARYVVSEIVRDILNDMNPKYPNVDKGAMEYALNARQELFDSIQDKSRKEKILNKMEAKKLKGKSSLKNNCESNREEEPEAQAENE